MFIHTYEEYQNQGWAVAAFSANIDTLKEIRQWCYSTYGPPGERWEDAIRWGEVYFSDKKDLLLFSLKWS